MWMIRAGEGAFLAQEFAKGYVSIGWNRTGDLANAKSIETIREAYERSYPNQKPGRASNQVTVIHRFRNVIDIGDEVITYDPESREYLVGEVTGDYRFEAGRSRTARAITVTFEP
jgi:restriction system protein